MNVPEAGQGGYELQVSAEAFEARLMREPLDEEMLELRERAVPRFADLQAAALAALAAGHIDAQRLAAPATCRWRGS